MSHNLIRNAKNMVKKFSEVFSISRKNLILLAMIVASVFIMASCSRHRITSAMLDVNGFKYQVDNQTAWLGEAELPKDIDPTELALLKQGMQKFSITICTDPVGLLPWVRVDPSTPKYPLAVPLSKDHTYFQDARHTAPDFWSLMPYYVQQSGDVSCSVASTAMILNAFLRSNKNLSIYDKNITEKDILSRVKALEWKKRVSVEGVDGRIGLTLGQLKIAVQESLREFGHKNFTVNAVKYNSAGDAELKAFRKVLAENETSSNDLIVIHFMNNIASALPPFQHISPVGAYDAEKQRILVLDVSREWLEPYWVSDRIVLEAMSRKTEKVGNGGYIRIENKENMDVRIEPTDN